MAAIESTAVQSNASTPMRRTSWKDDTDQYHPLTETEKAMCYSGTNNPFDNHYSSEPTTPTSTPMADIEAQHSQSAKPRLKYKALACTTLSCMIIVWLFLIMGILLLTDSFFPTAGRSYHMLKDLEIHLVDTQTAVSMLKNQVGKLYGYMDGYGIMDGFGMMGPANDSAGAL